MFLPFAFHKFSWYLYTVSYFYNQKNIYLLILHPRVSCEVFCSPYIILEA
jgi:hypothetical protein